MFVDQLYLYSSGLTLKDHRTHLYFSKVTRYVVDVIRARGVLIFYVLDNAIWEDRFELALQLMFDAGMSVVTPYLTDRSPASLDEVRWMIDIESAPTQGSTNCCCLCMSHQTCIRNGRFYTRVESMDATVTAMLPLQELPAGRFATAAILARLNAASRELAEFKGVASSIPNQAILINTLGLQEAKDSSAIENIVTTHDELFRDALTEQAGGPAKEVARYRQALRIGFEDVASSGLLTNNHILAIQAELEQNRAGFRKLPGTTLKTDDGVVVYTPPQNPSEIIALMTHLERFINEDAVFEADPLVKMALIHHQFESIHPFYDGNGRTGRIVCVLYLVKQRLLDIPILYLSRQIVRTKPEYYRLLQAVRTADAWEEWVLYMLTAVEQTARQGIATIHAIKDALLDLKHRIRARHKFYSQDLINNLFLHPYTKIDFLKDDLGVSRLTATKYLDLLAADGILEKRRIGRSNYYINTRLNAILTGEGMTENRP